MPLDKSKLTTTGHDPGDPWDCRACPVASDLIRWLDYLSSENAGLKFRNKQLRQNLELAAKGREDGPRL